VASRVDPEDVSFLSGLLRYLDDLEPHSPRAEVSRRSIFFLVGIKAEVALAFDAIAKVLVVIVPDSPSLNSAFATGQKNQHLEAVAVGAEWQIAPSAEKQPPKIALIWNFSRDFGESILWVAG
jgi:hypothetical protein